MDLAVNSYLGHFKNSWLIDWLNFLTQRVNMNWAQIQPQHWNDDKPGQCHSPCRQLTDNTSLSGVKVGCSSSQTSSSRRSGASSPVNIWPSLLTTGTLESGSVQRSVRLSSILGRRTRWGFLWLYGGVSPPCKLHHLCSSLDITHFRQNFRGTIVTIKVCQIQQPWIHYLSHHGRQQDKQ